MTDREKAMQALEHCDLCSDMPNCPGCAYLREPDCMEHLKRDIIALLKRSFTPQEVYDTVIEHAQHDKRFKLGDKIDYSFSDVVDILNVELMCKAGDM